MERPKKLPDEAYTIAALWYPQAVSWKESGKLTILGWVHPLSPHEYQIWKDWGDPKDIVVGSTTPQGHDAYCLEILAEMAYIVLMRDNNELPRQTT